MIGDLLLSHHSEAHSSCGAPVRRAQQIQLLSPLFAPQNSFVPPLVLFAPPPSISSPPLPSVSSGNIPLPGFFPPAHLLLLLLTQPVPPALPRAGGRGAVTRHLLITETKGALLAKGSTQRATPLGRRSVGKSSPPPAMLKTLSVWIRKEWCAPAEGAVAIKSKQKKSKKRAAAPPLSRPSFNFFFFTSSQFWDSTASHFAFDATKLLSGFFFL